MPLTDVVFPIISFLPRKDILRKMLDLLPDIFFKEFTGMIGKVGLYAIVTYTVKNDAIKVGYSDTKS
jgi:hypothetical protein